MRLEWLSLHQFRNYERCEFCPGPAVNLLLGPNGAGKTNLLEAVAVVLGGRSPRGARDRELVRHGGEGYRLRARLVNRTGRHALAAAAAPAGGRRLELDGAPVERRDLLGLAPFVWFGPDDLDLLKGPPARRRRFLDLLAAQLEPVHGGDLLAYARILAQRNELLRDVRDRRTSRQLADLFDDQLAATAARIVRRRLATLRALAPLARQYHEAVAGTGALGLAYVGGDWAESEGAEERAREALARLREQEIARGQTLWGPQRDDVVVQLDGYPARDRASQGQQRTLVLALKLAEYALLQRRLGEQPLLLLDDVLSELDPGRAAALARFVRDAGQVLISSADPAAARPFAGAAVFRVEGGRLLPGGEGACDARSDAAGRGA